MERTIPIFLVLLFVSCSSIKEDAKERGVPRINQLVTDMSSLQEPQVIIYSLPYERMFLGSVSSSMMVQFCELPLKTNLTRMSSSDLLRALEQIRPANNRSHFDGRWGAKVISTTGDTLHEIYVDRWGRQAIIDGQPFNRANMLRHWFENHFKTDPKA